METTAYLGLCLPGMVSLLWWHVVCDATVSDIGNGFCGEPWPGLTLRITRGEAGPISRPLVIAERQGTSETATTFSFSC